jgi:hypothetical protein
MKDFSASVVKHSLIVISESHSGVPYVGHNLYQTLSKLSYSTQNMIDGASMINIQFSRQPIGKNQNQLSKSKPVGV